MSGDVNGELLESNTGEDCEVCGSKMSMTNTRYIDDGYDYVHWLCTNDSCGNEDDKHIYH